MSDAISSLFGGQSLAGQTIVGTQGAAQAQVDETTRQKRLAAMQNSLAQLDSTALANIETNSPDARIAQNLIARRDTILTQRQSPGRTQTILANLQNRAI